MSGEDKMEAGAIAFGWWGRNIVARDNPTARGLAARLRRAAPLTALCEPAVHDLARDLDFGPERAETLIRLACLLAELRESDPAPLARRLARRTDGIESVLSGSRFEKLMRAEGEELTALLRRAIIMADRRCNVASLACDLIYWNPSTRTRWCFHYFGADAPLDDAKETAE